MAHANFIDRAATSASQVLTQFALEPFLAKLNGQVIGIAFDEDAIASAEGRATLDLLVRLIARLYPRLLILQIGEMCGEADLEALARSINPEIEFGASPEQVTAAIVVGNSPSPFRCTSFHVGSDGWVARLSTNGPVGSGSSGNPMGAGAAACFAAANVFRLIFGEQLPNGEIDQKIAISMLSFAQGPEVRNVPPVAEADIGETILVGAGAIGNGFLWTLERWSGIRGGLGVVDHEAVDLTNLQRYVLAGQADVETPKVDVAARHLSSTALEVRPHLSNWQEFLGSRADWRLERVATALDTAADRIAVQGALPKWIANAWTQETDLGVSRHRFGDGACLACLYMPAGRLKDQDELVAEEIGLPNAKLEVRRLLQTGAPVNAPFVERVATALDVPYAPLAGFVGQPLLSFYQKVICGGLVLKLTNGASRVKAVVPMAFQSALAGVMLAAEVVKHAAGHDAAPATSTRINLLRPLGTYLHDPKARDVTGRCICADQDFLQVYAGKYGRGKISP